MNTLHFSLKQDIFEFVDSQSLRQLRHTCHNIQEIEYANSLGLDYIILGPVIEKQSSENSKTLGWEKFAELSRISLVPVYAIGGLGIDDLEMSELNGGQGVAAIRNIWNIIN